MKFAPMTLVSLAAALTLGACAPANDESMANGEDSAMTTTDTESAVGADTPPPSPPEGAAGMPNDADSGASVTTPAADQCGAGEAAKYVGQEATSDVRARIIADVGHTRIRWVGPDTVVTMDYSPERLNVTMDADDVITGANCA